MADAEPGAGDIPIELDGKQMVLKPTLAACMALSKYAGGMHQMVQRIGMLDFDAIHTVIAVGLNLNPNQAKALGQAIFAQGLIELSAPCIDFVNVVANGGRPVNLDDEEGDQADPLKGTESASP